MANSLQPGPCWRLLAADPTTHTAPAVPAAAPSGLRRAHGDWRMVVAPRRLDNPKLPDLSKLGSFRISKPGGPREGE